MKILNQKFIFIIVFFVLSIFFIATYNIYKNYELDEFLELQTKEARHRYEGITSFPRDTSNFIFKYLVNTRKVIDIFKHANDANAYDKNIIRKKLYEQLKDVYKDLDNYNIQLLHFHLPNNESFLRFHRPEKFGDNLTETRKTVAFVNKYKTRVEGFEEGKIFNAYRYIYPLYDETKKYIGSVEISHSINSIKEKYQRAFNNVALNIVIHKDVLKSKLFKSETGNYIPYIMNNNFLHQRSMIMSKKVQHAADSLKSRDDMKIKMNNFEDFSIALDHKKHKGVISFIAIKNPITKKNVAYAISFQRSDYLSHFYEEKFKEIIYSLFAAFLLLLVFYFIYKYNKELERKVYNDSLMNIYNRRFFETYLSESCKKQKRNNSQLSLIMFDVDNFKSINDVHGHDIGDEALISLAKIVKEHIRQTDVFARWGGEEFMLLVETDKATAHKLAENLRLSIAKYTRDMENIPEFTCSFGVISLEGILSLEEAYKKVDEKLHEAKTTGKNKVIV